MKHLYRISSIIALTTVMSGGAWATAPGGLTSGDWVNKYFVDFDNDFSDPQDTVQNATALVTEVTAVRDPITGEGRVKREVVTIGNNLSVNNGVLSATDTTYTGDGSTIAINNGVISSLVTDTDTDTTYAEGEAIDIDANNNNAISVARDIVGALGLNGSGASSTLKVNVDGSTVKIGTDPTDTTTYNKLYVDIGAVQSAPYTAGKGIDITNNKVSVDEDTTSGALVYSGSGDTRKLKVNPDGTSIQTVSNALTVNPDGNRALAKDTNGVYVKVDGSSIDFDSQGRLTTTFNDTNTEMKCPVGWVNVGNVCYLVLTSNNSQASANPTETPATATAVNGALPTAPTQITP